MIAAIARRSPKWARVKAQTSPAVVIVATARRSPIVLMAVKRARVKAQTRRAVVIVATASRSPIVLMAVERIRVKAQTRRATVTVTTSRRIRRGRRICLSRLRTNEKLPTARIVRTANPKVVVTRMTMMMISQGPDKAAGRAIPRNLDRRRRHLSSHQNHRRPPSLQLVDPGQIRHPFPMNPHPSPSQQWNLLSKGLPWNQTRRLVQGQPWNLSPRWDHRLVVTDRAWYVMA